jgi:anti-sigma-K factor RskA
MTPSPHADHDRLLELLADQTLVGLDAAERQELESLLRANPDFDSECLDRTAAMLDRAAAAGDKEPLPEQLQDRIRAQGRPGLQPRSAGEDTAGEQSHENARAGADNPARPPNGERMRRREAFAWLAAAACLSVAVFVWYTRPTLAPPRKAPAIANSEPPATPPNGATPAPSPTMLTVAQQREQLLASAPDVLHLQLVNSDNGAVARKPCGDIVWSNGLQIGYLRLQGLANDAPVQRQYQLWIIGGDASSNEFINGGMFYVDRSTGELTVPIQADHFVQLPKMFLVSVEPLGGGDALTTSLLAKADVLGP